MGSSCLNVSSSRSLRLGRQMRIAASVPSLRPCGGLLTGGGLLLIGGGLLLIGGGLLLIGGGLLLIGGGLAWFLGRIGSLRLVGI